MFKFKILLFSLVVFLYSQDQENTFLINNPTSLSYLPKMDINIYNNVVISWSDERYRTEGLLNPNDGASDIFSQIYKNISFSYLDNFRVSNDTTNASLSIAFQNEPDVSINNDNFTIIVWSDSRYSPPISDNVHIFAQLYDNKFEPVRTNFKINQDTISGFHSHPQVNWIDNNSFVVSWTFNKNVYARIFDKNGYPVTEDILISDINNCVNNKNIILNDSLFLIYWQNTDTPAIPVNYQKITSKGYLVNGNQKIDYLPSHIKIEGDYNLNYVQNKYILVYSSGEYLQWDIFFQFFDEDFIPLYQGIKVNDDSLPALQYNPHIACDSNGRFIIVWEDQRSLPYRYSFFDRDIYAQRFNSNGIRIGNNFKINQNSTDSLSQYLHDIYFNDGYFGVLWSESYGLSGHNGNVPIRIEDYIYYNAQSFDNPDTSQIDTVLFPPDTNFIYNAKLYQNYPNPFHQKTNIRFEINKHGEVKIEVFDILGRMVGIFFDDVLDAGEYNLHIVLPGLSSGIYFYRLVYEKNQICKKMILY